MEKAHSKIHGWISAIIIISSVLLPNELPKKYLSSTEKLYNLIFPILIGWAVFVLFFYRIRDKSLVVDKKRSLIISSIFDESKMGQFVALFFLLWAYHPIGVVGFWIFSAFTVPIFLFFLVITIVELQNKRKINGLIVGLLFFSYFLFTWEKQQYVKHYGNEIIGSFFEKSEYKTQYLVNVFLDKNRSKNYRIPADLHIFTEYSEGYPELDWIGTEHTPIYKERMIKLERIYFTKKSRIEFENTFIKRRRKTYCTDRNGKGWWIELTHEKAN